MKRFVLLLLVLGMCGCGSFASTPKNLREVSLAVLATVDAAWDVADKPQIPDTLQGVQTTPAEPTPPVEEQVQPEPRPLTEESSSGEKQTDPPSVETDPSMSEKSGSEEKQKPLVTCYSSQYGVHCPGCIKAKQWYEGLSDKDRAALPFRVRFTSEVPNWVQAVPTFHWNAADKSYQIEGWHGPEHLIQSWQNSFVRHAAAATVFAPVQSACGPGGCRVSRKRR